MLAMNTEFRDYINTHYVGCEGTGILLSEFAKFDNVKRELTEVGIALGVDEEGNDIAIGLKKVDVNLINTQVDEFIEKEKEKLIKREKEFRALLYQKLRVELKQCDCDRLTCSRCCDLNDIKKRLSKLKSNY
jgi:hypothetical protein